VRVERSYLVSKVLAIEPKSYPRKGSIQKLQTT
jgi:hypothetical protein